MHYRLALSYSFFALIATMANIGAQDIVVRVYEGRYQIIASIIIGTGIGLIIKYLLDKRYIFQYRAQSVADNTHTFTLYTIMGLFTTLIFWGFELTFQLIFATKEMRYLGGIIGLAIGYIAKYHLDKKYVFRERAS